MNQSEQKEKAPSQQKARETLPSNHESFEIQNLFGQSTTWIIQWANQNPKRELTAATGRVKKTSKQIKGALIFKNNFGQSEQTLTIQCANDNSKQKYTTAWIA